MTAGREVVKRRRSSLLGRRARVTLLVVIVLAGIATAVRVSRVGGRADGDRERWRLHDEAKLLFDAGKFEEAAAAYDRLLRDGTSDTTARFNRGLARIRVGDESGWDDVAVVAEGDRHFDGAHQLLADRALERGDMATAARELTMVVDGPPAPDVSRAQLADLLSSLGRRAEAMDVMARLSRDIEASTLLRARAALDLARLHGRRAAYHRSPAGEMRREQESYALALRLADDALADPQFEGHADVLAIRPFALLALGKEAEALAAVDLALRGASDPRTHAGLRVLRAQMYWMAGDAERAEDELTAAVAGDRPAPAAFTAVADVFEARGFRNRAIELLVRGRQMHPDDVSLRSSLARSLFLAGRADEAEAELKGELDWPDTVRETVLLGDLRRARGDLAGARRAYARVLAVDSHRRDVELRIASLSAGLALTNREAPEAAVADLEARARALLEVDPNSPEARLALARALLLARDREDDALPEARALLEEALDADPLLFEAHVALAVANLRGRAYDSAVVGLERVIRALPNERPELRILLSEAYGGLGSSRRALDEARRAVDVLPDDPLALSALVRAARLADDAATALEGLAHLVELQPGEVTHVLAQAFVLAESGETTQAEERFAAAERVAEGQGDEVAAAAALRQVAEARAVAYSARGDQTAARGAFASLVGRLPRDVEARIRYARFLRATGEKAEAERAFQAAIAMAPENMEARRALVDMWCARNAVTPELAELVARMRTLGGDDPDVLAAEGKLAALQGDLRLARERLEAGVAARPDDADAQFSLGVVYTRAGTLEPAIRALAQAERLAPQDPLVREALARARFAHAQDLARHGRVREATALLKLSVATDPDAAAPRAALADVLLLRGDTTLGEAQVREMIRLRPDDAFARRMLASLLWARGELQQAAHELLRATESNPDDWTVWAALSAAYVEMGEIERAEQIAGRARDAAPDEPGSLSPLLQVLVDTGRSADAVKMIEAAVRTHPDEARYHVFRAMLHLRHEEHRETVAAAKRALALRPATAEAVELAAWSLRMGLGESDAALAFLDSCVAAAPESVEIAYLAGSLRSQRGDREGALALLRPLSELDPPHAPSAALIVMNLLEARDTTAARDLAERGLASNPEDADLHFLVAQSWLLDAAAEGDPELLGARRQVVIEALTTVVDLAPTHHTARNNLAYLLSSDEATLPDALEHAQRAVKDAPGNAMYVDSLGVIQLRLDRVDEALRTFRFALGLIEQGEAALAAGAAEPVARAEPGRVQRMRLRLERQKAEIQRHYETALEASGGN